MFDLRLLALAPGVVAGIPVVSPERARVVDGDTYWLYVQGLFRQIHYIEVRLDGYDTPEKQGPLTTAWERSQAKVAAQYAALWFVQHDKIMVDSNPDPESSAEPIGEIYVLGVDPAAGIRGLGTPLTAVGLDYLAGRGLDTVMLFVEGDNDRARRLYERFGFSTFLTNAVYSRSAAPTQ